jgi:hypothetical protein
VREAGRTDSSPFDPASIKHLLVDPIVRFVNASPLVNMVSSAKYDRDPSSLVSGAYGTFFLANLAKLTLTLVPQPFGPNSPKTNNAEWSAIKALAGKRLRHRAVKARCQRQPGNAIRTRFHAAPQQVAGADELGHPRRRGRTEQPGRGIELLDPPFCVTAMRSAIAIASSWSTANVRPYPTITGLRSSRSRRSQARRPTATGVRARPAQPSTRPVR